MRFSRTTRLVKKWGFSERRRWFGGSSRKARHDIGEVCFWKDRALPFKGGASYFARIHLENVIYRYLTLPATWFEMISADICRFLESPLFNQPGGCEILSCAWNLEVFNQEGGQLKVSGSSFAVKGDLHSLCLAPLHSHTISCTRRMSLDNPLD